MKILHTFLCAISFSSVSFSQLQYPITKKIQQIDTYFNYTVQDPYRWLEDDNSEETKAWVQAQNKVTNRYLDNIPFRKEIYDRIEEVYNYPKYSNPSQKKDWLYWWYNNGLQNQSAIYRRNIKTQKEELVLDPNTLSEDGTVAVKGFNLNKKGNLAGISISESGSDWRKIKVFDLAKKEFLNDEINWVKFSSIAWKDDGFYYGRYPEVDKSESKLTIKNKDNQIFYHKLGTKQSEDILIYEDKDHPDRSFYAFTSDKEEYLFISISDRSIGKRGNGLLIKNVMKEDSEFQSIVDSIGDYFYWVNDVLKDKIIITTNENAPNNKVIAVPLDKLMISDAKLIIPEREIVLDGISSSGNRLFLQYLEDVSTKSYIYDYDGKHIGEIKYPDIGVASNVNENHDDSILYYSFQSMVIPPTIYSYNLNSGKTAVYKKSEFKGKIDDIMTKRIFCKSKDGSRVPMFLVYKKSMVKNGKNPTLLYGYGGFNIVMQPQFSPMLIPFLEAGGVYAKACIRGGGEYGEEWHNAGTKLNKQNVFDDFIAAAEYLIENKYCSQDYLAINGGSNGGLLVGAVTNQRPDLFRVAIPMVGVMDMLRFHKFTIGKAWISDYGSSEIDWGGYVQKWTV